MPYVAMSDLAGMIPMDFLNQALDDAGTGVAQPAVWDQVAADAAAEVDGILGTRYPVPFQPPFPAAVVRAAKMFAACALYVRRGKCDKENNPFLAQRDAAVKQLAAIAAGDQRLLPLAPPPVADASGGVISERAKTSSRFGIIAS